MSLFAYVLGLPFVFGVVGLIVAIIVTSKRGDVKNES